MIFIFYFLVTCLYHSNPLLLLLPRLLLPSSYFSDTLTGLDHLCCRTPREFALRCLIAISSFDRSDNNGPAVPRAASFCSACNKRIGCFANPGFKPEQHVSYPAETSSAIQSTSVTGSIRPRPLPNGGPREGPDLDVTRYQFGFAPRDGQPTGSGQGWSPAGPACLSPTLANPRARPDIPNFRDRTTESYS
jgi:hypothetical protein